MPNNLSDFNNLLKDFSVSTIENGAKKEFLSMLKKLKVWRTDCIAFAEEGLGMTLNAYQKIWLGRTCRPRNEWPERFGDDALKGMFSLGGFIFGSNISAIGNQGGKTLCIAMKHIWMNRFKVGMSLGSNLVDTAYYSTLNLSPHSRQTRACYQYVKDILSSQFIIDEDGKKRLNELHPLMKGFIEGENVNIGEIRFINGSVMYSVPTGADQGSSLAGAQFAYVSYDECSQSLHLQEELGAKILSRLIKYGVCLDLIATPEVDSPSHQYYMHIVRLGVAGSDIWWALTGMGMDDNNFIPKEQRERSKATLLATDKQKYRQVVKGEFITSGKRLFDAAEIENMFRLEGKVDCRKGHRYLLSADWGMSDTGDSSVFGVIDFTSYQESGKMFLVNHESVKGGSPHMQFALLRTLFDQYTWYDDDGVTAHKPLFVMDSQALGGVLIKKLLSQLGPKAFDTEKDEALFILKRALSDGRTYTESEIDGSVIEGNKDYGQVRSYYIDELSNQLGMYHVEDKKLTTDFVMMLTMGVSHIFKKVPRAPTKVAQINPLASHNSQFRLPRISASRFGQFLTKH